MPLLAVACAWLTAGLAPAQDDDRQSVRVPIVMEEATVRGKVAILESRKEDRKVIEGLPVRVWSTKKPDEGSTRKRDRKKDREWERDQLLHESETDDLGLFDIPRLTMGTFLMEVSEVQFRLTVVPQAVERAGQTEPKVLLILIPKEVLSKSDE